jgi:phosphopentomutase
MSRAFLLVLDSLGIGAAPDAERFGDVGADTLGHIAEACARGETDGMGRSGPLYIPNLTRLGLISAAAASRGKALPGLKVESKPRGLHGFASEQSLGKDTPSGHWELAGVPVRFEWGYFPRTVPTFPATLTEAIIAEAGLPGILGDCHASGTDIIAALGGEHIATGKPIFYTSADSVLQIAAHEEHFGLERLYDLCRVARCLVEPYNIGRVIARPFVGTDVADFRRTGNRKDLAVPPPAPTLLSLHEAAGGSVISIGKIGDIYAHEGTGREVKADGNEALFDTLLNETHTAPDGALVMANFVDFDMLFGHRRDIAGYAAALEAFDRRLPSFEALLQEGDLAVITADHGCDPSWPGSDHTRENVPVIGFGPGIAARDIGHRHSFADVGQTLASQLGLAPLSEGVSFLESGH